MTSETPASRRRLLGTEWSSLLDDRTLVGPAWCRAHASLVDRWLADLFREAVATVPGGEDDFALAAVGGYGRRELAPSSDIDVWLLHSGRKDAADVAERLWYPVWDAGFKLGHGVGRPKEALRVAESDLATATTLLSARHVAGADSLAATLGTGAAERWRGRSKSWLAALGREVSGRHARTGEVAFLLEPDLKEGRGGLRDVHAIGWVQAAAWLQLDIDGDALDRAYAVLLETRVALQRVTGRDSNVLTLQDQAEVAQSLGMDDPDELMASVAAAARTVTWISDGVWRAVASALRGPGGGTGQERRMGEGVLLRDGAVALEPAVPPDSLAVVLHAAATAASCDMPLDAHALRRLAAMEIDGHQRWSARHRDTLVALLSAGRPAVAVIEALDQHGIWVRLLPEWSHVRNRPQRNPFHTFTVDRHLMEAAAVAAALRDRVARPDLLLLGALLHDIGKGLAGDHSQTGAAVALALAERLGFEHDDAATIAFIVEHHLLLPDAATRRDLDDPGTVARVAEVVGGAARLSLLAALTEADSIATGPAAWSAWKADLVVTLVERAHAVLEGVEPRAEGGRFPSEEVRALMAAGKRQVLAGADTVTVVAPDRPGVFKRCAGVLALHGIAVREARAYSDEMAVAQFSVQPAADRPVRAERLIEDLERVLDGRLALRARLAERSRAYERTLTRYAPLSAGGVEITFDNDSSAEATIIDVRAPDAVGLLHRITDAFDDLDLDIRSALITTVGTLAVDAFYVVASRGGKLLDPEHLREAERAILHAITAP